MKSIKINRYSMRNIIAFAVFTLFNIVAFNPDFRNSAVLWYGVRALTVFVCLLRVRSIKKIFANGWFFLSYFCLFISSVFAKQEIALWGTFSAFITILPMFLIGLYFKNENEIVTYLVSAVVALTVDGVYAINSVGLFNYIGVPNLTYWAANSTSLRYAIGFVYVLFLYRKADRLNKKIALGFVMVVFCYILIYCGSRGALILTAVSLFFSYIIRPQKMYKRVVKIILFMVSIVLLYSLMMNNEFLYAAIGRRFDNFNQQYQENGLVGAEGIRLLMIQDGVIMFLKKPILGYGYGGYIANAAMGVYSHNDYIEAAVEIGSIGMLVYYSAYLYIMKRAKLLCNRKHGYDYSLLFGCLVGLLIFNWVAITRYDVAVQGLICLLLTCIRMQKGDCR